MIVSTGLKSQLQKEATQAYSFRVDGPQSLRILLIAVWLVSTIVLSVAAQNPVRGNGVVVDQMRPLTQFSGISLDFSADLTIVNGETPSFRIESDENVLPHIGTQIRGGKLFVTQDKWIEPSQPVKIRIGTPFTSSVETSGYSDVVIEGITGSRFRLDAGVGKVVLRGSADRLQVRTKTGSIDAVGLESDYADVGISSHGKVRLGEITELVANVSDNGLLIYDGSPKMSNRNEIAGDSNVVRASDHVEEPQPDVRYVQFTLVNNSRRKMSLRVEGPRNRSFGYGFNLFPKLSRAENWPIGSKVYQARRIGDDKLLLEVTSEMSGERVKLFNNDQ